MLVGGLWLPSARRGVLGYVGDGRATGRHRRIVNGADLRATVQEPGGACAAGYQSWTKGRIGQTLRIGHWPGGRKRVLWIAGDGSAAGHPRRFLNAAALLAMAEWPAVVRAGGILGDISVLPDQ